MLWLGKCMGSGLVLCSRACHDCICNVHACASMHLCLQTGTAQHACLSLAGSSEAVSKSRQGTFLEGKAADKHSSGQGERKWPGPHHSILLLRAMRSDQLYTCVWLSYVAATVVKLSSAEHKHWHSSGVESHCLLQIPVAALLSSA